MDRMDGCRPSIKKRIKLNEIHVIYAKSNPKLQPILHSDIASGSKDPRILREVSAHWVSVDVGKVPTRLA